MGTTKNATEDYVNKREAELMALIDELRRRIEILEQQVMDNKQYENRKND